MASVSVMEEVLLLGDQVVPFAAARFGSCAASVSGNVVVAQPLLADTALENAQEISGNIVVIKRCAR